MEYSQITIRKMDNQIKTVANMAKVNNTCSVYGANDDYH